MIRYFLLFALFFFTSNSAQSQTQDSLKGDIYFKKAMKCHLFSQERQRLLDTAILYQHDNPYYWQQKSMPLFKQKKYELGMIYIDSAVLYDHTLHWREYRAYIKCIFQKNYRNAIEEFQYVKRNNENGNVMDHTFNLYIGICLLQLNEFEQAKQYIEKSIAFRKKTWGYGHHLEYFYLGIVWMELNHLEKALEELDNALKLYSNFPDAKYYKAQIFRMLQREEEAKKMLTEAKSDINNGYTLNEDNIIYEEYPYQIKTYWLR